ncbi:hypothetical protein D3C81_1958230 [compost metagenome]
MLVAGGFPEAGDRSDTETQLIGNFLLGHIEDALLVFLNKIGKDSLVGGKGAAVPIFIHCGMPPEIRSLLLTFDSLLFQYKGRRCCKYFYSVKKHEKNITPV